MLTKNNFNIIFEILNIENVLTLKLKKHEEPTTLIINNVSPSANIYLIDQYTIPLSENNMNIIFGEIGVNLIKKHKIENLNLNLFIEDFVSLYHNAIIINTLTNGVTFKLNMGEKNNEKS